MQVRDEFAAKEPQVIAMHRFEARQQIVRRQVDQFDFVRFVENAIRQRLLLADTRMPAMTSLRLSRC